LRRGLRFEADMPHDAPDWKAKDSLRLERRVSALESELKELRQALATVQGGEIANSEAICALQPLPVVSQFECD
jgi:hypothetical protein